jgi:hypothetical protein
MNADRTRLDRRNILLLSISGISADDGRIQRLTIAADPRLSV